MLKLAPTLGPNQPVAVDFTSLVTLLPRQGSGLMARGISMQALLVETRVTNHEQSDYKRPRN